MRANEQLLRWRKEKRLTQTQAAELLGVQLSHYQKLEYATAGPSLTLAAKIEQEAGVHPSDWVSSPDPS